MSFLAPPFVFVKGARLINLQREGKDPDPILLSYIPALKAITDICADIKNKKGFVLKPKVH